MDAFKILVLLFWPGANMCSAVVRCSCNYSVVAHLCAITYGRSCALSLSLSLSAFGFRLSLSWSWYGSDSCKPVKCSLTRRVFYLFYCSFIVVKFAQGEARQYAKHRNRLFSKVD
ncbi:hypothetical protein F5B19DRAFT_451086 [Rostrohypoxylon terebratum]|nr:hypothetical protein F5B19DRAFT_451086 [Rostrohypoxylon terebratum]